MFLRLDEHKVIGHRFGGCGKQPENTLAALREGQKWARIFETDIQRTRNGLLVIFHDKNTHVLTGVSNRIELMTAAEVATLKINGREPIPTLQEIVTEVRDQGLKLIMELKFTGLNIGTHEEVAAATAEMIKKNDLVDAVMVHSFWEQPLAYLHKKYPEISTGWILDLGKTPQGYLDLIKPIGVQGVSFYEELLSPELVRTLQEQRLLVFGWTLGSEAMADFQQMRSWGVNGIITDYPDLYQINNAEEQATSV